MEVWKIIFLFNWVIFSFRVNFQGCRCICFLKHTFFCENIRLLGAFFVWWKNRPKKRNVCLVACGFSEFLDSSPRFVLSWSPKNSMTYEHYRRWYKSGSKFGHFKDSVVDGRLWHCNHARCWICDWIVVRTMVSHTFFRTEPNLAVRRLRGDMDGNRWIDWKDMCVNKHLQTLNIACNVWKPTWRDVRRCFNGVDFLDTALPVVAVNGIVPKKASRPVVFFETVHKSKLGRIWKW